MLNANVRVPDIHQEVENEGKAKVQLLVAPYELVKPFEKEVLAEVRQTSSLQFVKILKLASSDTP